MGYRDDQEAAYQRAAALQRQVDELREKLAARDRELAEARAQPGSAPLHAAPADPLERDEPSFADQLLADLDAARIADERVARPLPPPIPTSVVEDPRIADLRHQIVERLADVGRDGLEVLDTLTGHLAAKDGVFDLDVLRAIALLERAAQR